jgi:VanZ family protein
MMNLVNGSSSRNNTNVKANTSLLLGIISVLFELVTIFGIAFAVAGLVFGLTGLKEIRHTEQPGRGKAIAGLICSTVAIVIPLAIFFLYYGMKLG